MSSVSGSLEVPSCGSTENVCCYFCHCYSTDGGLLHYSGIWQERPLVRYLLPLLSKGLTSLRSSAIIEDINAMRKTESALITYFYFDFKDNYKQSRLDVVPSLLTQLSAQSKRCRAILSCLYSAHNRGAQMPTSDVLTKCLKDMLSLPGQPPIYIILDAIDECPDIPGVPSPRGDTLELLKELIELRLPNLRLCVTSRPEIGIRAVLEPLLSHRVSLHDENGQKKDIEGYISAVVNSDRKFERWREEDKCLVIKTLSEQAGGMSVFCCALCSYSFSHIIYYLGSDGCPASWIGYVTVSHRVCAVFWMNYLRVWTRHTSAF
jgi:hypothetical protein